MFENLAEKLIFVVFASFCAGFARADEACPDGLCAVPQGEPNGSFPVLSPLPQSAVDVGWKPYHMQQGYGLNESTLSCASAINWGNNLVPASSDPETIKNMIAWDAVEKQQMAVGSGMPRVYRTFLLTPDVVKDLAKAYKSKDELEAALIKTARTPLAMHAYANYYGNPGSAFDPETCPLSAQEKLLGETEMAEETETPPWLAWTGTATASGRRDVTTTPGPRWR